MTRHPPRVTYFVDGAIRVGPSEERRGSCTMADDAHPLLDTLVEMTTASVERAHLDEHTLMMVRLGALAAENAPASSYLLNFAAASETLTAEDVRSALIAVAPIIGTPRVVSAAGAIFAALGIAVALDDAIRSGELSA